MCVSTRGRARWLRHLATIALLMSFLQSAAISTAVADPGNQSTNYPPSPISTTAWQSPQFGTFVSWSRNWAIKEGDGFAQSNEEGLFDLITIFREDVLFAVTIIQVGTESPESYRDRVIETREDLDDVPEFEIVESGEQDGVAYLNYSGEEEAGPISAFVEVRSIDEDAGLLAMVTLTTWEGEEAKGLEWVLDDIQVNDEIPFQVYVVTEDGD